LRKISRIAGSISDAFESSWSERGERESFLGPAVEVMSANLALRIFHD
jgi:hypothetical protein